MKNQITLTDLFKQLETDIYYRVIRIDLNQEPEGLLETLKKKGYAFIVYGIERIPKLHMHMVLGHKDKNVWGKQNGILKRWIKKEFNVEKSQFSTSSVRTTIRKSVLYAIKDCELKYYGISEDDIKNLRAQSTRKFQKEEFKTKMEDNENTYYDSKGTEQDEIRFHQQLIEIKSEYGQNPNPNAENRYVMKHIMKKNPYIRQQYQQSNYLRINQMLGRIESPY